MDDRQGSSAPARAFRVKATPISLSRRIRLDRMQWLRRQSAKTSVSQCMSPLSPFSPSLRSTVSPVKKAPPCPLLRLLVCQSTSPCFYSVTPSRSQSPSAALKSRPSVLHRPHLPVYHRRFPLHAASLVSVTGTCQFPISLQSHREIDSRSASPSSQSGDSR